MVTDLRALIREHIAGTEIHNGSNIDYKTAEKLSEVICTQILASDAPEPLAVRSDTEPDREFKDNETPAAEKEEIRKLLHFHHFAWGKTIKVIRNKHTAGHCAIDINGEEVDNIPQNQVLSYLKGIVAGLDSG